MGKLDITAGDEPAIGYYAGLIVELISFLCHGEAKADEDLV